MKIYTKTGDKGQTSLTGGKRVVKFHERLEAYGTIDELNSFIGLLIEYISNSNDKEMLEKIQSLLFSIGGQLASTEDVEPRAEHLSQTAIPLLEAEIDNIDALLPPLKAFVLPGGCKSAALAHVCRTIARRSERCIYRIPNISETAPNTLIFINRLSDYFFVLARKECILSQKQEKIWHNACE